MFSRALTRTATRAATSSSSTLQSFAKASVKPTFSPKTPYIASFSPISTFTRPNINHANQFIVHKPQKRPFSQETKSTPPAAESALSASPVIPEATAPPVAEAAQAETSKAAYDKFKGIDPALIEAKKAQIKSRMKYFRIFTVCWMIAYFFGSKKFYTMQISRFENPAELDEYNAKHKLHDLYKLATRDHWADELVIKYNHKDDLQDRKEVQKLVLKHVMMSQQLAVMLKEAEAELLRLRTKYSADPKYLQRLKTDTLLDWVGQCQNVREKIALSGVTSLLAYNHNMEDDETWYSGLNPLTRASKKATDLALSDAFFYPIYAKLALRRVNAYIIFINSMMNDDWYADNVSKIHPDQFEQLFSWWEHEQGFNRFHFERIGQNGALNIEPNCQAKHIGTQIKHSLESFKKDGKQLQIAALTLSPIEQRVLSLPDDNQLLDLSYLPEQTKLANIDQFKDVMDPDTKQYVPRTFFYYTPLPPLPTKPAQSGV